MTRCAFVSVGQDHLMWPFRKMYYAKMLKLAVNRNTQANQEYWCAAGPHPVCWIGRIAWNHCMVIVAIRSQWGAARCRIGESEANLGRVDAP